MEEVIVSYYSGSKGDEYPRYFYWKNKKHFVKKILGEEKILDINTGKQIRHFLVETGKGKKFQVEEKEGISSVKEYKIGR